ncbi:hypothetical protein MHBO_002503 [Bonamia ostreae]|uniref:Nicastrin n=1 Tax=Bonamia ostreae TaxID=126728 RepID=A0ABV2AML0_9EUKA
MNFVWLIFNFVMKFTHSKHFSREDMYTTLGADYCIRHLTRDSKYGCASSWKGESGRMVTKEDLDNKNYHENLILLISADLFTKETIDLLISKHRIKGIVVNKNKEPESSSHERQKPFISSKPNGVDDFVWNEKGDGLIYDDFNIPVAFLSSGRYKNFENTKSYLKMKSEMFGKQNSQNCIEKMTCSPVGGFSPWSLYGGAKIKTTKFLILSAGLNSNDFFSYRNQGASTSVSGLAALLSIAITIKESKVFEPKIL